MANETRPKPVVDVLTVLAIAALAGAVNVGLHEGIHAVTCLVMGGQLNEFSALHVECTSRSTTAAKVVSGSAPIYNLILGAILWRLLPRLDDRSNETRYFVWLFMLLNFLGGSGYFMFSGIAGVGDIASVMAGWEPVVLWRVLSTLVGTALFGYLVYISIQAFGRMVGGEDEAEQIGRAIKITNLSFAAICLVTVTAGLFHPEGFASLPVIAGLMATLGGGSPLMWMMQWFRAKSFIKVSGPALTIERDLTWILAGAVVVLLYSVVLGRGITF